MEAWLLEVMIDVRIIVKSAMVSIPSIIPLDQVTTDEREFFQRNLPNFVSVNSKTVFLSRLHYDLEAEFNKSLHENSLHRIDPISYLIFQFTLCITSIKWNLVEFHMQQVIDWIRFTIPNQSMYGSPLFVNLLIGRLTNHLCDAHDQCPPIVFIQP
ncbi:hypothetical protein A6X21_14585 [Planctopirus hydrillae]|uniref:Uncharacterized protein n=1 Tax=Planctopirus hydrillae TaxID=1841610 RepID=A0A1C3E4B0_9PLAN|nr:hypothetical protein A6X21_14585 [Planctopirus hydrillae]